MLFVLCFYWRDMNKPIQRKTTLKWSSDGELSSIDMTRILDKLAKSELIECDLTCDLDDLGKH